MKKFIIPFSFLFLFLQSSVQAEVKEENIQLKVRGNITQEILLLEHPDASAYLILFPGGAGVLKFNPEWLEKKGMNFLVRIRERLYQKKFSVIVINAPEDHQKKEGMKSDFRGSKEHASDIETVLDFLQKRKNLPVWLIGTSRGTNSAANGAIRIKNKIHGLILSSPITATTNKGKAIKDFDLSEIQMPVLILSHKNDECPVSIPEQASEIKRRLVNAKTAELKYVNGGINTGKHCRGLSHHGFNGLEDEMVNIISKFINEN